MDFRNYSIYLIKVNVIKTNYSKLNGSLQLMFFFWFESITYMTGLLRDNLQKLTSRDTNIKNQRVMVSSCFFAVIYVA